MSASAMPARSRQPSDVLLGLGLIFLLWLAYLPALTGKLLWNDPDYVTKAALRSVKGLSRIWFEVGATEQYYPVLHSAFWIQHRLWGDAPIGYHLASLLFHALGSLLFGLVLRQLGFARWTAWVAVYLFALHPVCVESVAWISEEKNTLSLVFYLAAALGYLSYEESGRRATYAAATGLFALALLSKSVTATLPASLLVLAWWRRGSIGWRKDVRPLLAWFAMGAIVGLFTAWVEKTYIGAQGAGFALSLAGRVALSGRIVFFYLGKIAVPWPLMFIYPHWRIDPAVLLQWAGVAGVLTVTGVLLRLRRRGILAAWLLFVGSLFPVIGLFNVYAFVFSYVADHWVYLSLLPVVALVATGWGIVCRNPAVAPAVATGVPAAVILVFLLLDLRQATVYRSVESLYAQTLAENPRSWLAHSNLAVLRMAEGKPAEAISHYEAAIAEAPEYPEIHSNLADAYLALGRPDEAIGEYRKAIALNPAYTAAEVNLALTLVAQGHPREAVEFYETALRYQPNHAEWELDLGLALVQAGRLPEAIAHDRQAVRLDPTLAAAHLNLGNALAVAHQWSESIVELNAALSLQPDFAAARTNLGIAYYQAASERANAGHLDEAIAGYRKALGVSPDFAEAHANLGLALATAGQPAESLPELNRAVQLKPNDADAHAYLGFSLAALHRYAEAIQEYSLALRLRPHDPDITYQLNAARRAQGHP